MSGLMVEMNDAAHQPLVAGDPPLMGQASGAALEILHFMASGVGTTTDVT